MTSKLQRKWESSALDTEQGDWLLSQRAMGRISDDNFDKQRQRLMTKLSDSEALEVVDASDDHHCAHVWARRFLHWYLITGIGEDRARENGIPIYSQTCRCHLTHCYEDECHDWRELIDATAMYTIDEFLYFCHKRLSRLEDNLQV